MEVNDVEEDLLMTHDTIDQTMRNRTVDMYGHFWSRLETCSSDRKRIPHQRPPCPRQHLPKFGFPHHHARNPQSHQ